MIDFTHDGHVIPLFVHTARMIRLTRISSARLNED